MATPYLHSGESIVLTTHRVSVEAVSYDIMLTTERLFLIDNRNARFEPRVILLDTVLSVQGGKTPASEPVITLLFLPGDAGTVRPPVNLVFQQNPNEKRKAERDDWVRSLIQLSVSRRENAAVAETPVMPESPGGAGLRPAARHGLAPERVRPLSNIADRSEEPAPVAVIPEEVDRDGGIPATVAAAMASRAERPLPQEPPAGSPRAEGGPALKAPAPSTRIIMPQIIEEMLPERKAPAQEEEKEQEAPAAYDPEVLFRAIPTAARSTTITEERTLPAPPAGYRAGEEEVLPGTGERMAREIPDIIRALQTGPPPPEPEESAENLHGDMLYGAVQDSSGTAGTMIPEQSPAPGMAEAWVREPAGTPLPDVVAAWDSPDVPEPEQTAGRAAAPPPPVRHQLPPATEIRPFRATLVYAIIALFVIALVAAGALFLLSGPEATSTIATPVPTPAPTPVPVTAVPPVSLPATTLPTTVVTATTRQPAPAPAPASLPVPKDGIWVLVSSTTGYSGTLGNAGFLRTVAGTGDNLYRILWNDKPVQVSVRKNDNSGANLSATVYRNGTPLISRFVTAPMGSVDILIDPVTDRAPGLTGDEMLFSNATTRPVLENS